MFKWFRRRNTKIDFEIYLRVWLQNNENIAQYVLSDIKERDSYNGIIDDIINGDSIVDKTFGCTSIYISKRLLPMAEHKDDLAVLEECILKHSFDDIPYGFWLIFHFLYLGVLHKDKGELSRDSFLFGRDKIIAFFVDRGMNYDLVREYIIDGILNYRSMAREAVGKAD